MKQQIVAVPEPDWRDLLWRVGLVTVLAPAILVFVAR